jgi:uncharacterized protein (TIGR03067 family)
MRLRFLMAVIVLVLRAGASDAASGADGEKSLQGVWIAASGERNGAPADDLKGHRLTFTGNRFVIRAKGKLLYEGTFRADASKTPATIDFTHTAGEAKGKVWLGVYLLQRDVLKICDNADDLTKGRPAALSTGPGTGQVLLTFKRGRR